MSTIHSKDGTKLAYDVVGDGQPLILVDGATAHRAVNPTNAEIASLLSDSFRVYTYDRRGRGDSGDTQPYAVEREIEDIAVLIADAGAPAMLFGWSSGAVLAMHATAAGLPVTRLALFEPPFVVDAGRPPLPSDYVARLDAHTAAGEAGEAAALFLTAAAGVPTEMVEGMRHSPYWPALEAIAHTIAYDGRIMATTMSGNPLPADRWATVTVPTLVMHGNGTEPWLAAGARAAADALPNATLLPVEGEQHSASAETIATALRTFAT